MFGQKKTILENLLLNGAFVLCLLMAVLVPVLISFERITIAILGVSILGAAFITVSKWPAMKNGQFISFGPSEMNKISRKYYFIGYGLVGLGVIGTMWVVLHPSFYGLK